MRAIQLKTEYRTDPIGLDCPAPRFTWKCADGAAQRAFRVLAWDGESGELLWDSARVETDRMHCTYGGTALRSAQQVCWTVTLWDETGEGAPSEGRFEMGLLSPEDWSARWICGVGTDRRERLPADEFRREFAAAKPVQSARLYATACGVYRAVLNGSPLPGVLAPGTTEYEMRLHYQVYDVTDLIQPDNVLCFTVGDGWYKGKLGASNNQYFFGTQLKLLAQVVLHYADGTREVIGTDSSWRWCDDGPIRYADLKDGEIFDARQIPTYSACALETDFAANLIASPAEGIREHETFPAKLLISPSGATILDFGQNLAGYIRFRVEGERGQRIRLRMCEALDHGEYSNQTLIHSMPGVPEPRQEIVYTCAGGPAEFQPAFFYAGFRYALVEGLDKVNPADFEAVAVYSAMEFTGDFDCSNALVNQFLRNTRWSLKSNFVDVPTDCPQREKSGWTGDAQIFVKTASYLADGAAFYRKWLRDVRDCQREDGRVDNICPKIQPPDRSDALNGSVGWADAAVIIPYTLWKLYGDERFITENIDLLRGWKEYVMRAAADKTIYHLPEGHPMKAAMEPWLLPDSPWNQYIIESGLHWGEWAEPDISSASELVQPKQELAAAYTHYSMSLLAEMLRAIGREGEADQCAAFAQGAKQAYNCHFVKDGHITAPRQAPMVRALALGLLDEKTAQSVAADLDRSARDRHYTVGTGFLSTPFVLDVLARYGYLDTAYRMLENTAAPGWLAMPAAGATTVWEYYTAYDEQGHPLERSMNHYSPGAVCAFLFETAAGIRVAGENRFTVSPQPGGTLTYARAVYDSPYGRIVSGWERTGTETVYTVEVPANTTAELTLPDGTRHTLTWGVHRFTCGTHQ